MTHPSQEFFDSITDPNLKAAVMAANLVGDAIAAPPRPAEYDDATLDAAIHAVRELIVASKWRETAATLNRAVAAIEKLRA